MIRSKCTFLLLLLSNKQLKVNVKNQATKMEDIVLQIMIWSGVAAAILLAGFVFCCKSIFLQSKLEFNAEKMIN